MGVESFLTSSLYVIGLIVGAVAIATSDTYDSVGGVEKAAAWGAVAIWPVGLPLAVVGCVVCLGIVGVRYGKRLVAWLMERIDEGGLDAGEREGGE